MGIDYFSFEDNRERTTVLAVTTSAPDRFLTKTTLPLNFCSRVVSDLVVSVHN